MDKALLLTRLGNLKIAFDQGDIPMLHKHVVTPPVTLSSRENYLFLILTCALNFQRSSPATWQSALKTWNDSETQFLFFPEKVVTTDIEQIRSALLKHRLGLQPNKHTDIWYRIAQTFHQHFHDDPRELFKSADFDVMRILNLIQKEMKTDFPYLSGPKLSNYSLFILLLYSDLKLKNTKKISIIPDTHIKQATVQLGMIKEKNVTPEAVAAVWDDLLAETEFSPMDFHSLLWNWSRNNFRPAI